MNSPRPVREVRGLTRAVFEAEVLPAYEPLVIRGLVADWPAVAAGRAGPRATAEYLAGFAGDRPLEAFVGAPEIGGRFFHDADLRGFNFERHKAPLRAILARLLELEAEPAPHAIYAGAAAAADYLPGFAVANPLPLLGESAVPRVWVGNDTAVAAHYDLSSNIACCVAGRRRFTLFPPEQVPNLYVGPLEHTIAGQPASLAPLDPPDLGRFPRTAEALAAAQVAELEPGDAVFVPVLWWHQVRASGPLNVLVNYWWGQAADSSPFEALIHGLLAIRDLPAPERAAWRAIFDHYVFEAAPESVAHLPEAARGPLGPASPAKSRMIRGFLRAALARR